MDNSTTLLDAQEGMGGEAGTTPREVREMNLQAAEMVGQVVRTTLGPLGLDKLLVDDDGMSIVTNSGASILKERVSHPIGDMIVQSAISQESEVEDGTTTTAIIASALLSEARDLLNQGLHPTSITVGFTKARRRSLDHLETLATPLDPDDEERLNHLAATSMTGKAVQGVDEYLADVVVEAVQRISDDRGVDTDNVRFMKSRGGRVEESHVLDGIVLNKDRARASMPISVEKTGVLLLEEAVTLSETEVATDYRVREFAEFDDTLTTEDRRLQDQVNKLAGLDVGAVVCAEEIDDPILRALAERDIYAVHRVTPEDIELLTRTTGTHTVPNFEAVSEADVGYAAAVFERNIEGEPKTIIEGGSEGTAATLVLKGVSRNLVDELARASRDALESVRVALDEERLLPGGAATETELARMLRGEARTENSRQQLAIEAYAGAFETIPMTLAENTGRSSLDTLLELRTHHAEGGANIGVSAPQGDCTDMIDAGVVEPFHVKRRVIENATDAANMILRIDGMLPRQSDFSEQPS